MEQQGLGIMCTLMYGNLGKTHRFTCNADDKAEGLLEHEQWSSGSMASVMLGRRLTCGTQLDSSPSIRGRAPA